MEEFDVNLEIINAYTQYTYWEKHPVEYCAIRNVFKEMNSNYTESARIGIPKIGAGYAGGNWETIEKIINDTTPDIDITLVEWDG